MSKLNNVIIHCSDSEFGCAAEIRRWHLRNGWSDIGYNFVILNGLIVPETKNQRKLYLPYLDGMVEVGRRIDGDEYLVGKEVGAHTLGYNAKSLGVCLIGVKDFTPKQFYSLAVLCREIEMIWKVPASMFLGHYDVARKACPNFDVQRFMKDRDEILSIAPGHRAIDVNRYRLAGGL